MHFPIILSLIPEKGKLSSADIFGLMAFYYILDVNGIKLDHCVKYLLILILSYQSHHARTHTQNRPTALAGSLTGRY